MLSHNSQALGYSFKCKVNRATISIRKHYQYLKQQQKSTREKRDGGVHKERPQEIIGQWMKLDTPLVNQEEFRLG